MVSEAPALAVGWHPDPQDPAQERLYDGIGWTPETRRPRGPFAAKYAHKTAGIWLSVIGGLFAFGLPGALGGLFNSRSAESLGSSVGSLIFTLVVAGGLLSGAVYLLRGRGRNPAPLVRSLPQRQEALQHFRAWVQRAAGSPRGVGAVLALRNAQGAAAAAGLDDGATDRALHEAGADPAVFESPLIGQIPVAGSGDWFEVRRDWVVCGLAGYDVDEHTNASVYLDGSVQLVASRVDEHGRVMANDSVDMRQASLQVVSDSWSLVAPILPDDVPEARRIADQLMRHVHRLAPRSVSAAEIRDMVNTIINHSGQPIAEKLTQLSNLRYDRILTDDEFEQAKDKLLGNPGGHV